MARMDADKISREIRGHIRLLPFAIFAFLARILFGPFSV